MTIDLAAGEVLDATGGTDTLVNIKRVRGTDHNDVISGNDLHNRLRGDAGNDILKGGVGNDDLQGGAGSDTIVYSGNRSDYTVTVDNGTVTITDKRDGGEGTDTVIDAEFFRFGATTLSLDQVLKYGSAITLSNSVVAENSKAGVDVGVLSVANVDASSNYTKFVLLNNAGGRFQLAPDGKTIEVKNGILLDYDQARSHTITVQAIDESLGRSVTYSVTVLLKDVAKENTVGTTSSDTLSGGASTDTLSGGGGNDILNAGGGNDKVDGGIGNDRIDAGSGNDSLAGGSGNDLLDGGTGKDSLTGGSGRDMFIFDDKETSSSKTSADYISDFSGRSGDKIDLRLVDANTRKSGDQNFSFIGTKAFSKEGQVRYEKTKGYTYVHVNTDADKSAEAVIKMKGSIDISKGWFVL